jgi:hypothetical protein
MEPTAEADQVGVLEWSEVEWAVIEEPLSLGVGGEKDLKPPVEPESIDDIGPHSAADGIGGFDNVKRYADFTEAESTTQPGEAGPDNQHLRRGHVTS